ncbi:NUDIX hydrolase domain-like protein [Piptocephalis cylindrospora]|uniref:Large ribosomal subunit protein mL46 n=1 Tax=Piptocephalis cylindrospora TaxID=1907219 RepID=A0A4P9Y771_9FUNG|nr:NUDIX hydrolase domain-like protein [Piptocephalis cylindrospora]|eukprot:RKP14956.1 NUDIX hydrolase domain-like protein [Piptocephalis cylindrospora]
MDGDAQPRTTAKADRLFKAGIVLTRPPIILPEPNRFAKLYYAHRQGQADDMAAPFPVDFYFKKGSIAEKAWMEKEAAAGKTKGGRDLEATIAPITEVGGVTLEPRENNKRNGDVRSLERHLDRTLYLIVKKPRTEHAWAMPQGLVEGEEQLHETAMRELHEECGQDMNVWLVARGPIGHYAYEHTGDSGSSKTQESSVYFLKAHILAGQCRPDGKEVEDFAWVTRDEMSKYVSPQYYKVVKKMLSEQ